MAAVIDHLCIDTIRGPTSMRGHYGDFRLQSPGGKARDVP